MNDNEYEMNLWTDWHLTIAITAMTVPINDDKKYLEYLHREYSFIDYSINPSPTLSFENEINIKTQDKVDWKKEGF